MLKTLLQFADTISEQIPPFQYARGTKHWEIKLDGEGNFQEIKALTREDKKGKLELGNPDLPASPHLNRNDVAAKLLTDTAEYVFGMGEERAVKYHEAYLKLLQECYAATQESAVKAIINFLENQPLPQVQAYLEKYQEFNDFALDKGHVIRFKVNGIDPTELKQIQIFWAEYCSSDDLPRQPCLVTGEIGAITTKLEHKLKGVPDTQASGASLISAYCDAFHSYGCEGAKASPIGVNTAEIIAQVLSYLISHDEHKIRVGPVLYLFWGEQEHIDPNDWFNQPQLEDVKALLQAFKTGKRPPNVKAENFYILALSGGGGRVIVRDFLQTTVEEVKFALANWFAAQNLIDFNGESKEPIGLYSMAAQAYRDAAKELQPHTLVSLMRCALQVNSPLPKDLLHKVLERVRVQRQPNYRQASLIKLILISWGVNITVSLDERMENLSIRQKQAYCCGRLLASFATIQYYALGQVNSSVIDDNYGAAATTPSRVFGHLEVKVQAHLADLRKSKPGMAGFFTKQLEEIHAAMPGASFPNTLTLEEQGIFAMGYWHQKAYRAVKNDDVP